MIFGWFFELLGLLWACFRLLLLGGLRPSRPTRSWLGFRCSWLGLQPTLPRKSKNLPRTKPRIQEPAEDKAEKKIRTDAYRKNQISKLRSSKLLSLSQTSLLQNRWAAVLPPGGASINIMKLCESTDLLPNSIFRKSDTWSVDTDCSSNNG